MRACVSLGAKDRDHHEAATARGVERTYYRAQQFREYLMAKYLHPPLASGAVPSSVTRSSQMYELRNGLLDIWVQSRAPIDVDAESLFEFDAEAP